MNQQTVSTENDADDSDSLSDNTVVTPKRISRRSATVSPATRNRLRNNSKTRRRSDANLFIPIRGSSQKISADKSPLCIAKANLRKTNSLPSVEQSQQAHVQAIRQLLDTFPLQVNNQSSSAHDVWTTPRQSVVPEPEESDSGEDLMNTDIEELREAAESIQSLQRVLKIPSELPQAPIPESDASERTSGTETITDLLQRSGIAPRAGAHPRGVIQFLPSVKPAQLMPALGDYPWDKSKRINEPDKKLAIMRRKTSVPETYMSYSQNAFGNDKVTGSRKMSSSSTRRIRSSDETEMYNRKNSDVPKSVDSLAGVSRFSKLLRSLRSSRQSSPEPQTSMSWKPLVLNEKSQHQRQQPIYQADLLLWKRRSRASLRRHTDIRNMAIRELHDTEKTFVETLEYLVQKYMRPLRQPLECSLIDPALADKIFYKIPEILAHHQHFLAALSERLEDFPAEPQIGDVLLSHFRKQSMVETYIAFVDNFKYAKQSIAQARLKPAFDKYYMRCCREHHNKLDLDSFIIAPIQRVPRYELIIKQILKHTSVEHPDYENLVIAQKHIHELAAKINKQKEESEEMEQRLREIEAIVDGLDDLVTTGRSFNRYDVVNIVTTNGSKQRCLFLMSDQLIVTSVRRKSPSARSFRSIPSTIRTGDFLESNRFKLLFKISLDDVEIGKETLSLLQQTELRIRNTQEDLNIINKMIELSKLLREEHKEITDSLDHMRTSTMHEVRILQDQLVSDQELTTVHLQVTTINGVEPLTLHFPNAEKRASWEKALFSVASPTLGKNADGAPNVWVCTGDKFSGQIAVINVNGEPTIENSTGIGNSAIMAICPVPAPRKRRKYSLAQKKGVDQPGLDLESSSSETEESDKESSRRNIQSTVWLGNDDGEIFVFNFLDNVRLKAREKCTRLPLPIDDIIYIDERVFVSLSSNSHAQLIYFQRSKDGNWDLDKPTPVQLELKTRLKPMLSVVSRLCAASGNSLYLINPYSLNIEKQTEISSHTAETVGYMAAHGSTIFISMVKSSIIKIINAFTLECVFEFSISHVINKVLSTREDIIRQHKMGCLRISALLCCKNMLWIGTSSGIILNKNVSGTRNCEWTASLNVVQGGHVGPCRFLTAVNVSSSTALYDMRRRRMSLNAPSLQQIDQMLVISGGEGFDSMENEIRDEQTGNDDAINYLLFWTV
ncbi:unnamed protein product [Enterobius vermicularis]|uniref:DH domain-containing protein n=1 Tax=Enterobius vermicularis TaxID=51028 RepID=A0A0N4VI91_ENTVE|nr:unnamed protein product [Enterobius vermicularis]